jgi:predicted kinase
VPQNVKLIVVCGVPFAGKTTLAGELRARFDLAHVDVDETKIRLYGDAVRDADLTQTDWDRIYRETDREIAAHLMSGRSVVDASRNFRKSERALAKRIADQDRAQLVTIFVDTPEDVVRQRLLENRRTWARHDVMDQVFEEILRAMEPPTSEEDPLILPHGEQIDRWLARHVSRLSPENGEGIC